MMIGIQPFSFVILNNLIPLCPNQHFITLTTLFFGYGWMYEHPSNDDQGLLELGVGVILLSLGGGISGRLLRSHLLLH